MWVLSLLYERDALSDNIMAVSSVVVKYTRLL